MLWHSFTKLHTQMHLGSVQGPVYFQGQRSNNTVTRSQDRSNGCRGIKSISIISQYMQSYWFSKQSKINMIYNILVITITITMSIILANFGKYAISDCPFILNVNHSGTEVIFRKPEYIHVHTYTYKRFLWIATNQVADMRFAWRYLCCTACEVLVIPETWFGWNLKVPAP